MAEATEVVDTRRQLTHEQPADSGCGGNEIGSGARIVGRLDREQRGRKLAKD